MLRTVLVFSVLVAVTISQQEVDSLKDLWNKKTSPPAKAAVKAIINDDKLSPVVKFSKIADVLKTESPEVQKAYHTALEAKVKAIGAKLNQLAATPGTLSPAAKKVIGDVLAIAKGSDDIRTKFGDIYGLLTNQDAAVKAELKALKSQILPSSDSILKVLKGE